MELITKSPKETANLGRKLSNSLKGGEVFALVGDLGSGKTTFLQGLAVGLGIKNQIKSPTFILLRKYEVDTENIKHFYHLDLYRLEGNIGLELENLGAKEIWEDNAGVTAIEWAGKATGIYPPRTLWINFEYINENERRINIQENNN